MRRVLIALAACLVVAPPLAAQASAGPARGAQLRIDYIEDSLPNGLKLLYHVDRSTPVAAVLLWYDVGSRVEPKGRTGFAHLFEHVMFEGSKHVADGEHFGLLEKAGARGGADINGTTSNDRTNYFEQVPSNQVELALWLEADRMGTLLDVLTPEKLEIQRDVVKNERRQGVDNQPYGTFFENMMARVFPAGHPYHHPVIGSMDDLSAATLDDVKNFFRTYYAPNNAVLVVAGDFEIEQAKTLIHKYFDGVPSITLPSKELPAFAGRTKPSGPVRELIMPASAATASPRASRAGGTRKPT